MLEKSSAPGQDERRTGVDLARDVPIESSAAIDRRIEAELVRREHPSHGTWPSPLGRANEDLSGNTALWRVDIVGEPFVDPSLTLCAPAPGLR